MKTKPHLVRLLKPEDAPQYVALRRAMLLDSPLAYTASPGTDLWSEEPTVCDRLGRADHAIVGAFDDARLVGAAGIYQDQRPKMAHRAGVWGVFVEPAARAAGVGEAILRTTIDVARSWPGVRIVFLTAGESQLAARRLYERLGFVTWGIEPDALTYEGGLYREVHMQLKIA